MAEKDYKKLGLKCGLEIHQQLDTDKLFIYTPSKLRDDKHDFEVRRKLKAVSGETGSTDAAAIFEESAEKMFIYQGYHDTISDIEIDEEPPRVMDEEALSTVIQVSKILSCSVVDEVQVMRKTVVDGSNTSGFQRTSLVGRHGTVKVDEGHVGIPSISIEEDSAKIVSRDNESGTVTYNLSRLGIPLIEIGTDPDITTPKMAKDVASRLGMILRSTGKVKRGLGTIRQDLNVSITGGARIEIKGAQDLKMIPKWIDNEIDRQTTLIKIKDWLKKRKAKVEKKKHDLSPVFKKTSSKMISSSLNDGGVMLGIPLRNFSGALGEEVNPGRRVGTELSDYAKAASGVKGIIHSDEKMSKYGITASEEKEIRKVLDLKEDDSFILVMGPEKRCEKALEAVIMRVSLLMRSIPEEVRRTNPDGTTSFMRPMPGASRMYPETDCVPIPTHELIEKIELPELIDQRISRYVSNYDLSKDLAEGSAKFDYSVIEGSDSFDHLCKRFKNIAPSFIAQAILSFPKELKKRFDMEFSDDNYKEVLMLLEKINSSEINSSAFMELLPRMIKKEEIDYTQYKPVDESYVRKKISEIVKENGSAPFGALMGMCMKEFRGKVDGKKISDILKEETKK